MMVKFRKSSCSSRLITYLNETKSNYKAKRKTPLIEYKYGNGKYGKNGIMEVIKLLGM